MAFAKPASYEHLTGRGPVLTLLQPLLRRNSTTAVRRVDDWSGPKSASPLLASLSRKADLRRNALPRSARLPAAPTRAPAIRVEAHGSMSPPAC